MSAPVVTGILSYGMSGRIFHAPFVSGHQGFTFKAVTERHKKTVQADYPEVISYDSIDELLTDPEIELVIVNTPGYTHYDYALKALQAGKHVLLEKPAVATVAQLRTLYELAHQQGKHLMVYQNRRWDSDFLAVKQVIESGRLGELIEVTIRMDRYKHELSPKKFKEDPDMPPNGLVYDLGPHLLDQAITLFGRPLSFHKITAIHREQSQVPDYFSIQLSYPHQLNVTVASGLLIAQATPAYVVHGTLGTFIKERVDPQETQLDAGMKPWEDGYGVEPVGSEGVLVLRGLEDNRQVEHVPSLTGNYNGLFDAVYNTIRHNALYPVTEEHLAWQLEIIEA